MKTNFFKSILVIVLSTSALLSCSNDKNTGTPPPPGLPELLYAEGGQISLTAVTNPSANATTREIFGRNGTTEIVKIKLTSFAVATYTIGVGNEFTYTRPSTSSPWVAGSGTITITANAGNKISGTFDLPSGTSTLGINQLRGSFSEVPTTP